MRENLAFYADCLIVLYAVGHAIGILIGIAIWIKETL